MKIFTTLAVLFFSISVFGANWDKLRNSVLLESVMHSNQKNIWFPSDLDGSDRYVVSSLIGSTSMSSWLDNLPLLPLTVAPSVGLDIGLGETRCINIENADLRKANKKIVVLDNYEQKGKYLKLESNQFEISLGAGIKAEAGPLWVLAGVQLNTAAKFLLTTYVEECNPKPSNEDDKTGFLKKLGKKIKKLKNYVSKKVKQFKIPDAEELLKVYDPGESLSFERMGGVRLFISAGIKIVNVATSATIKGNYLVDIRVKENKKVQVSVDPVKGTSFKVEAGTLFFNIGYEKAIDIFKHYDFEFDFNSKEARNQFNKLVSGRIDSVLEAIDKEKVAGIRKVKSGEGKTYSTVKNTTFSIPILYSSDDRVTDSKTHETTILLDDDVLLDKYIGYMSYTAGKKSILASLANKIKNSHGVGNYKKEAMFLGQVNRVFNPKLKLETYRFFYGANLRYKIQGEKFNKSFFEKDVRQIFGRFLGSEHFIEDFKWFKEDKKLSKYLSIDAEIQISNKGLLSLMSFVERTTLQQAQAALDKDLKSYFSGENLKKDPYNYCTVYLEIATLGSDCSAFYRKHFHEGLKLAYLSLEEMRKNFYGKKLDTFNEALKQFGNGLLYGSFVMNYFIKQMDTKHYHGDIVLQGEEFRQIKLDFNEKFNELMSSPNKD